MNVPTLNSPLTSAELCRANGWTAGTLLVGDEGYGPTVIEVTAVGERSLLAKRISHKGIRGVWRESSWTLRNRDWKVAE